MQTIIWGGKEYVHPYEAWGRWLEGNTFMFSVAKASRDKQGTTYNWADGVWIINGMSTTKIPVPWDRPSLDDTITFTYTKTSFTTGLAGAPTLQAYPLFGYPKDGTWSLYQKEDDGSDEGGGQVK